MPIPAHTIDGILPPFVGIEPGGSPQDMTPYPATAHEIAVRFGTSPQRQNILLGWLNFRAALRSAGIVEGFQWIDGSFVEDKEPNDVDVVTFYYRPALLDTTANRPGWFYNYGYLLNRSIVKWRYTVDSFPFDLRGNPEVLVDATRYFGGLFSHRRGSNIWKGMLTVRLEDLADDQAALATIGPPAMISVPGAVA